MNTLKTYQREFWLVSLPLLVLVFLRILGFDGMVGQDSYAYSDYAKAIRESLLTGQHPGDFQWPPGFPFLGALLSFSGLSVATSLQLISCLSWSLSLIFVAKVLKKLFPAAPETNVLIYLVLFGVFGAYYLRNGLLTMSDMLSCFLGIASLYYAVAYAESHRLSHLALAVFTLSFSPLVRYPAVLISMPVALFIIFSWVKSVRNFAQAIVLLIPLLLFWGYHYFESNATEFLNHGAINQWSFRNYFSNTFHTGQGAFHYFLPNILFVCYPWCHYGFLLLGLPFLFLLWKSRQVNHPYIYLSFAACLCYGLFLAGIDTQNARHLLLVYPFVLVLCFYGFNKCYHFPAIFPYRKALLALGLVMQITLCLLALRVIFQRNALEQKLVTELRKYASETKQPALYSFDIDIALASRGVPFQIQNLWQKEYDHFESGALVLFSEAYLGRQWEGKNPMINWNHLQNYYRLTTLAEYDNDWKLYRIE